MKLTIQGQGIRAGAALTNLIRAHVQRALRNQMNDVVSVEIYLKDVNGPKGGADKLVRIRVLLQQKTSLVAEATRSSLPAAIAVASRRIRRCATRAKLRRAAFSRESLGALSHQLS